MLLDELAAELVEVTSSLVSGRTINVMDTEGIIVASTEKRRIGTFHQGAREAVLTGKLVNIRKVAWGQSKEDTLVEILTAKILERLK